jgi:cell division protein FtsZ
MQNTGSALMGIGTGTGENRVVTAAKQAISSPLLEMSVDGAKGVLFTVTGSSDLGMQEFDEAAKVITSSADPEAKVIFGTVIDDDMKDEVKVCVIATGFDTDILKASRRGEAVAAGLETASVEEKEVESAKPASKPSFFSKAVKEAVSVREKEESVSDDIVPEEPVSFTKKKIEEPKEEKPMERQVAGMSGDVEDDLEIPAFIRRKLP